LVDEEAHIIGVAKLYLEREAFHVISVGDERSVLDRVTNDQPALMVLDLMLPELDGYEVYRRVRAKSDLPILMVTARVDEIDKIIGLELDADDYLTQPFNPWELVARVKAILRRSAHTIKLEAQPVHPGDVTIDSPRREVTLAGKAANLRTKDFDLLLAPAEHRGVGVTREQLPNLFWRYDYWGQTRRLMCMSPTYGRFWPVATSASKRSPASATNCSPTNPAYGH
jgi:DNA-binding response OmpR family regulator